MADMYNVHYISHNVGLTANTVITPIFKNITANGAITILDANFWSNDGTCSAVLVYCDATGGTVGGTVATLGSASQIFAAAGTAQLIVAGAVTAGEIPPNAVVALEITDGTAGADTHIELAWVKGIV